MQNYIKYLLSILIILGYNSNCDAQPCQTTTQQTVVVQNANNSNKIIKKAQIYENKTVIQNNNTVQQKKLDPSRINMFEPVSNSNTPTRPTTPVITHQTNNIPTVQPPTTNTLVPSNYIVPPVNNVPSNVVNQPTLVKNVNQNNIKLNNNVNKKSLVFEKTRALNNLAKELEQNIVAIKQRMIRTFGAIYGGVFGKYNQQLLIDIQKSNYKRLAYKSVRNEELANHLLVCKNAVTSLVNSFNKYIRNCNTQAHTITDNKKAQEYNTLMNLIINVANNSSQQINTICNM